MATFQIQLWSFVLHPTISDTNHKTASNGAPVEINLKVIIVVKLKKAFNKKL